MATSSKPSLSGRKRIKDIQESVQPSIAAAAETPVQQTLKALQESLAEEISGHAPKPSSSKGKKDAPLGLELFEEKAFEFLMEFHRNLKNSHQAIRVSYTLSEQNRRLLDAIKKVVNYYAENLKAQNRSEKDITQTCQKLLNNLVSRLIRQGVKIRPLSLVPDR